MIWMALQERNTVSKSIARASDDSVAESACTRVIARRRAKFTRLDRSIVNDDRTMGNMPSTVKKMLDTIGLAVIDQNGLRHDLALVCPTLAENDHYVPVMLMNDFDEMTDATIEPVTLDSRYPGKGALNPKFKSFAVRSLPVRGEGVTHTECQFSTRGSVLCDGIASGAKGEVAYHAAV